MPFPASVPSLPAAFVLIAEVAPFRPMSETLNSDMSPIGRAVGLVGTGSTLSCQGLEVIRQPRYTSQCQNNLRELDG